MKKHVVIFTDEAQQDFIDIWVDIAEKSQCRETATSVTEEIEETCRGLDILPERGRMRNDIQKNLQCLTHDNYLIFYTVVSEEVFIKHIFHGSRDYMKFL